MGENPTCPDIAGNTLLHMLARKGDASVDTLRALIALRYSDEENEKEVLVNISDDGITKNKKSNLKKKKDISLERFNWFNGLTKEKTMYRCL